MFYLLLIASVASAYYSARHGFDFLEAIGYTAGFDAFILLQGYSVGAFEPYVTIIDVLVGWIAPWTAACIAAFYVGRWRRRS